MGEGLTNARQWTPFHRVGYDGGENARWDQYRVGARFHEFAKLGTLVFDRPGLY